LHGLQHHVAVVLCVEAAFAVASAAIHPVREALAVPASRIRTRNESKLV
jgi:hypothetical protein